ncbi:methyltransferase family protein [Aminobacter aminovorans]|uniref:Protein-S-isoprenylcysteine O-methyltransferase Ste14 n=2 Tax=Aminobacter aminovorans TaxID=83263 RepID=A0ABR6H0U9_AMIAI|nr:isoprenylcysteine carboxylmethyltransferase family protein [Aminobacter aminovorans]MBB3704140.1 protein-S-isoprenylcysteine O-methyltransferase Ste14 [Aminobacter aminovorans]
MSASGLRFSARAASWQNPSRTAAAILTVVLMVVALLSGANLSPGEQEDRANRWVLPALGVIGLLSAILPAYDDRIDFWTIGGETIRWIGVALFAAGGMLRLWPFFVLGSRFSGLVAIQPGHRLVTSGIYALVRHPSYLGLLVNALGWALVFRSGVGVILVGLTLVPLIARIRSEERLLRTHFGAEYGDYARRTWRLVPGLY